MRSPRAQRHSIKQSIAKKTSPVIVCSPLVFPHPNRPYSTVERTNAPNSFSSRSFFPSCSTTAPDGVSSSTGMRSPQRGHETNCTTVRSSASSARPRRNLTPAQLPQSIRSRGFASHGTGILCPQPGQGSFFRLPLTRRAPKAPAASPGRSRPPSPRRRR